MSNQGSQKGRRQIWKSPISYHKTDCIKMMYVKFGRYRLKKDYVRAQAWHDLQGGGIWEGPIAYLVFVQFLKTNVLPKNMFPIAGDFAVAYMICKYLQGWNSTRLENYHLILQSTEHFSSCGKS